MLSPEKFEDQYPPEDLEEKLPDRPISSLRDVQYLYGRLYTLATAGGGEYAAYLTPDQASDLLDEEESLIVVRADLSGNEPRLADDQQGPLLVTRYTEDLIGDVAHSYYYNRGSGIDHSITNRTGAGKSRDDIFRYSKERLTRWTTEDAVSDVAESHQEGEIIRKLAALGNHESEMERLKEDVNSQIGGKTTALVTVKIKCSENSDYQWPGEIDVFNSAMRRQKLRKLTSKGSATDSAGTSTDLITGSEEKTVGTAQDPLNFYLGKQLETFPGLDANESWRTHSVSEDTAVTIMNAETFVDACTYSTFGATVYYLPYFIGRIAPQEAYQVYDVLHKAADDGEMTPVEHAYEMLGDDGIESAGPRLRFYVAAVMKHQASRYDVFGDTLNGSIIHPVALAESHRQVLRSWVFDVKSRGAEDISPPLPSDENWQLLSAENTFGSIATGWYFRSTFSRSDDDQDAAADDARIDALVSILSGEPLAVETLVGEYVERLMDEEGDSFPSFLVASQYAQLCALARANLLTTAAQESDGVIDAEPDYDQRSTMHETDARARTDGGAKAARRARKLEQFIDETPALRDSERRGSFLLGALVGQVGGYQQTAEGRSTTVVDQYSIKSMTKTRLKRITQEVLDRNVVYSRENQMRSTMYAEVVDRLVDTLAERDPDSWEISTDDLRFYYALGVSYGLNNWTKDTDTDTDTEEN